MEEYLVSARKYRPATFDTVVGQRALTTTLLNAIKMGKLAHAYLFCGPRGVGKTTCARIFAKTINCMNPGENMEACNQCESCQAFDEGRSMNIHELDAASNNSVDDIRELIKQVQIPPQIGRYKVFIIDEVHMLTASAFNAFLKTLEEPPSYAIFILATTEKHKILPTILSRCQVYDFQRMSIKNTVDHLRHVAEKEGIKAEDEALNLIALKADGGMRDALSIFDQVVSFTGGNLTYQQTLANLNVLDSEYYFRLVDHFLKHEVEPCMLILNEVINRGFDAGIFIGGLAAHLRDVLVSRDEVTLELLEVSDSMKQRFKEQAQRCEPKFLYRAIKLCNECDQAYRNSKNKRLQVEICLIECAQEDDILGRGRRPKTLKPLFKVPAAQLREQQTVASANTKPATTTAPASTVPPVRKTESAPLRTISMDSILSINIRGKQTASTMAPTSAQKETEQTVELKPTETTPTQDSSAPSNFDQHGINICWQSYANRLPKEHTAMAQRMRAITPNFEGDNLFSITVNSELVKRDIQKYAPYITSFFEQQMQHTGIQLDIKVANVEVVHKTYTKPEVFRRMVELQPQLLKLKEALELEID